jgi:hypothetical protein
MARSHGRRGRRLANSRDSRRFLFSTVVQPDVDLMFKTPGPNPNGLQATDEGLWIYDQGTNRFARLVRRRDTNGWEGSRASAPNLP